jgi:hypothetical protein
MHTSMTVWAFFGLGLLIGVALAVTWVHAVRDTRWAAGVTAVATLLAAATGVAALIATTVR